MLRLSPGLKKYFFNTNWLFLNKIFRMGVSLVVGVYVARYLGPERLGMLNYAMVVISFIVPFWKLGLKAVLMREFVENKISDSKLMGTSVVLQSVTFFFSAVIFIGTVSVISMSSLERWLLTIIYLGNVFTISDLLEYFLTAKVKGKQIAWASITSSSFAAIVRILLVVLEAELIFFAVALIVEFGARALSLYICFRRETSFQILLKAFDISVARYLFGQSWPLIFSGSITGMYMKIDQVMIRYMVGLDAIGLYSVAMKSSEYWFVIPIIINRSVFPAIVKGKEISSKVFRDRMLAIYSLFVFIALSISAVVSFFSNEIVLMLFGEEFVGAGQILSVYVWSIVFLFINISQSVYYLLEGQQKKALFINIVAVFINIILNVFFIEKWGATGAAYSTIITYAFVGYFANLVFEKTRNNFFLISRAFFFPLYWIIFLRRRS
jgi:O-antigen/teichoic acid export membrane protein